MQQFLKFIIDVYVQLNMFQVSSCSSSTNQMQQFLKFIIDVYVQLNMFQVSSRSSSGAQQLQ